MALINFLPSTLFFLAAIKFFKLPPRSALYLLILPLIIFSPLNLTHLTLALLLGFLLFGSLSSRRPWLILTAFTLVLVLIWFKPHFNFDLGFLNDINTQRGEHPNPASLFAIFFHNKISYIFLFFNQLQTFLSPVALFAKGVYRLDYPLPFLFPWDLLLIVLYLTRYQPKLGNLLKLPLVIFLLTVILVGAINSPLNLLFCTSIIYCLAIYIAKNLRHLPPKLFLGLLILDLLYLLPHLALISYFP